MIHVIYTINYLIVPNPSIKLIIGVLYLFLRDALLLQVTKNSTETGLRTNGNSLAHISGKHSYGCGFWASHMVLIRGPFTRCLILSIAGLCPGSVFCIFSHGDKTATRPPLERGLKFPGVIIKKQMNLHSLTLTLIT